MTRLQTLFKEENLRILEVLTIAMAIVFFVFHFAGVFIETIGWYDFPGIVAGNYLAAIATPFSIILIYEVYLLIVALSESLITSVRMQFQVLSLIIIRDVFKQLSEIGGMQGVTIENSGAIRDIWIGVLVSVAIFILSGVFIFFQKKITKIDFGEDRVKFLRKVEKLMAILVSVVFVFLLAQYALQLGNAQFVTSIALSEHGLDGLLAKTFIAMIFADIIILLIYFVFNDGYSVVFRNASFVIAVIMARYAVIAESPYDIYMGLGGVALGVVANISYYLYLRYIRCELDEDGNLCLPDSGFKELP